MRDILHSDLNNFYASVEILHNPKLKGKNVIVGGSVADRHSIVLAKSTEARKYGIKTGEVIWKAKQKCPNLIIVPPHFELYVAYSKKVQKIYYDFTNLVESFGIDECWLDVTESKNLFGTPLEIAQQISDKIKQEIGLTVSIGVSHNKILAKMGSNYKKPDAITVITKENFKTLLWDKPVDELTGVGRSSAEKLKNLRIRTIKDLANTDKEFITKLLGKNGIVLREFANGIDNRPVDDFDKKSPIKSIGNGFTLKSDLTTTADVKKAISRLSVKVSDRLRSNGLYANTIELKIKGTDFKSKSYQKPLKYPTMSSMIIRDMAMEIFLDNYRTAFTVRAVSLRCLKLQLDDIPSQINMYECQNKNKKIEKLDKTLSEIRKTFGEDKITFGNLLNDEITPQDKTDIIMTPEKYKK